MLRIKNAQINFPAQCRGCEEVREDDELNQGFCEECLASGFVKSCSNCEEYMTEDEGHYDENRESHYCQDCTESLYGWDQQNRFVRIV